MMKQVILLSGGLDSAVCLAQAVKAQGKENVIALSFAYGQKHQLELQTAQQVAQFYKVEHLIAKIDPQIFSGSSSTLLQGNGQIAQLSYQAIMQKNGSGIVDTYVPFRNDLMISQAAALAYSRRCSRIVYGAHVDDAAGNAYPDCSPSFYHAMNQAIVLGTDNQVHLAAPLITRNKAGVVQFGQQLKVPFELTRSCYEGQQFSCGKCATCRDRIKAFKINGLKDPIKYEIKIDWEH